MPAGSASLADLWQILAHGRGIIAATAAVLVLATLAYCLLTPPLYNASAEIIIDPREKQVLTKDVNPSTVAPDGGIAQIDSQVRVLQSSSVLLRAIAALKLSDDPEYNGKSFLGDLLGGASNPGSADNKTLAALKKRLSVKRADKVLVVEVIATAQSPDKAARIANAIADAYLADQAAAKEQSGKLATESLTSRLAEQRRKVELAENAIQTYKVDKRLISASGQLVSEQQLTDLAKELEGARLRTGTLKVQIDQLAQMQRNGASTDSTAEAIQSATIAKLREQEALLGQRTADLQSQLGQRHPAIAAAGLQLSDIRRQISAELVRVSRAAKADYDRALASERRLSETMERLKAENLATSQDFVRLRELERDLEASRSVYSAFLLRANETREQAGIDSTNARIITRAAPPQDKSWPLIPALLAGALGAGLGLGATGALMREYARPTLLTPGQAERAIGVPVIGVLPPVTAEEGGRTAFDAAAWMALRRLFDMEKKPSPRSPVRSLLLLGSAASGQAALDVARAAAKAGEKVICVTASQSREPDDRPGLAEVLRGERHLRQVMRFEHGSNLYCVSPGIAHGALPERAAGEAARQMLMEAARNFDLMVIDAGDPRGDVSLAPLMTAASEVVVLAAAGITRQAELVELADAADVMGRPVSAILLTGPAKRRPSRPSAIPAD